MSLWERTQEVFVAALDVPAAERGEFLTRACGGDGQLRAEVESLLAHDIGEERLEGVFRFAAAALVEDGSLVGQRVGAYRIESELGHGGMGTVYLASRADDEFRKKVAIKVVKWGMDSRATLERFRYERQILAGLDHPYIARLMDGGSTEDRQPFFVMEYVVGRPIDRYCREETLGIAEICRLFLRVCEAVAYAHRNLVVHRDLKPSNIIVTADGTPRLLDFGVAKLLGSDAAEDGTVTALLYRPLTPEYASPEQVRGQAVSTVTDVYSLGAVLYELLTGTRIHSVSSNTAAEWERAVCETEVPRPSLRRPELSGDLDNILLMALRKEPERRYSSVEQLAGDIERFLTGMPVAARQDSFRYRTSKYVRRNRVSLSAAALVAASLLVGTLLALAEAREAGAARRTAEHERALAEDRSRQAEAARQLSEREHAIAEQQRAIADHEASRAKSEQARAELRLGQMVVLANKSLLDVHGAIERLPGSLAARREIINTTLDFLEKLQKDAGDDPQLRIALAGAYLRVGELQGSPSYPSLGDTPGAVKSLDRAAEWVRPLLRVKPPNPDAFSIWIDARRVRAEIYEAVGQPADAIRILEGLLPDAAVLTRLLPLDGREATMHQVLISALQSSDPARATEHARLAVDGYNRLMALDPKDADTVLALSASHSLWAAVLRPTDPAGAMEHYRESVRLREELLAKRPNNSAARRSLMLAYGQVASILGDSFQLTRGTDVEGARAYYEKAAAMARDLAKADPLNRVAQYDLASVELRLGALDPKPGGEAESLASLRRARGMFEGLVAADPQAVRYRSSLALAMQYIGNRLRDAGNTSEAIASYRESLAILDRLLAAHPDEMSSAAQAIYTEQAMAHVLAVAGDRGGAVDYARRALDRAERSAKETPVPATRMRLASAYAEVASVQQALGNWLDARAAAVRSADEWRRVLGDRKDDPHASDLANVEKIVADCDARLR